MKLLRVADLPLRVESFGYISHATSMLPLAESDSRLAARLQQHGYSYLIYSGPTQSRQAMIFGNSCEASSL